MPSNELRFRPEDLLISIWTYWVEIQVFTLLEKVIIYGERGNPDSPHQRSKRSTMRFTGQLSHSHPLPSRPSSSISWCCEIYLVGEITYKFSVILSLSPYHLSVTIWKLILCLHIVIDGIGSPRQERSGFSPPLIRCSPLPSNIFFLSRGKNLYWMALDYSWRFLISLLGVFNSAIFKHSMKRSFFEYCYMMLS